LLRECYIDEYVPSGSHHRRLAVVCHVQLRKSFVDIRCFVWRWSARSRRYSGRGEHCITSGGV